MAALMFGQEQATVTHNRPVSLRIKMLLLFITFIIYKTLAYPTMHRCHQAEAGSSVTLEWPVSEPAHTMHCLQLPQYTMFLNLDKKYHHPQHQQFVGRVQGNEDLLRTARIWIRVSPVRTSDEGRYLCAMATDSGRRESEFCLKVTELPKPKTREKTTPESTPGALTEPGPAPERDPEQGPESRGRSGVYAALGLVLAALVSGGVAVYRQCKETVFSVAHGTGRFG